MGLLLPIIDLGNLQMIKLDWAESAAGAVLDLIRGLNDMEDELIRAGVSEAVHETIKNRISE